MSPGLRGQGRAEDRAPSAVVSALPTDQQRAQPPGHVRRVGLASSTGQVRLGPLGTRDPKARPPTPTPLLQAAHGGPETRAPSPPGGQLLDGWGGTQGACGAQQSGTGCQALGTGVGVSHLALSACVTGSGIEPHFTGGHSACQLGHVIFSQRCYECQLVVNQAPDLLVVTNPPRQQAPGQATWHEP